MNGTEIESLSIFGEYKQMENRVTAALLHILNAGKENLIRFFAKSVDIELPSSTIQIVTQQKNDDSVPDGFLSGNFSFKIFIESKITPNSINEKQLINHLKLIKNDEKDEFNEFAKNLLTFNVDNKDEFLQSINEYLMKLEVKEKNNYLLYITPDIEKPMQLGEKVFWANWADILSTFKDYLLSNPDSLLKYLIDQYELLLFNNKLILPEWNWEKNNQVVVFAGGTHGEETAKNFKYYFNQNERNVRPSGYLAFYTSNRIKYCYKINNAPKPNFNLFSIPEITQYLKDYFGEDVESTHPELTAQTFYTLGDQILESEIPNDLEYPYTMGMQRYTQISKIKNAKKISEIIDIKH